MMNKTFGYRVVRIRGELGICEVYYDEHGDVDGITSTPMSPTAPSIDDLRHELQSMLACLDQPVLEHPDG